MIFKARRGCCVIVVRRPISALFPFAHGAGTINGDTESLSNLQKVTQLTDNGAKFPTRVSLHWVSIFLSPCSHIYHSLAVWPWGSHFTFLFWNFFIYKVKAVLGWPESLFGFFHTILDINLNELFGQPNKIIYIKDCADVDFRKIQKEKNNYHILMHIYGI